MSDRANRHRKPKKSRMYMVRPLQAATGRQPSTAVMSVIAYGNDHYTEAKIESIAEIEKYIGSWPVVWLNIDGLTDSELLNDVGTYFNIRHLAVTDSITLQQRAKFERHAHVYNLICHMVALQDGVQSEQLNIFLGSNFVITLQDGPIDCLDPARDSIKQKKGIICRSGPDYLVYKLVHSVVGAYFPILEAFGERLDQLEDQIIEQPTRDTIAQIHTVKRDLLALRRTIWPLREAINSLLRDAPDVISDDSRLHLRDCYDHAVQVIDLIETYRELGADLMDVYLSCTSNKLNEVMKVLAIITTICAPPTLVAGIYGMNFNPAVSPLNMPELEWHFGYIFALAIMGILTLITLGLMWYNGWLGDSHQIGVPTTKSNGK